MVWTDSMSVWINNHGGDRMYFSSVVEARERAIRFLEFSPKETDQVYFYPSRTARNHNGLVMKQTRGGQNIYTWHHYTKKYGMVRVPLYKNGKIKRGC